jgi:hypothetical protein
MKRMTLQKAPQGFTNSPKDSVSLDCFARVLRARRRKSAGGTYPGGNHQLVASQNRERKSSDHTETPRSESNSVFNSANSRSHADRRGLTTISTPRGTDGQAARRISRIRLRIRFLRTARPNFRGVVSPTRLWSSPLASTKTTKERESLFAPPL